MWKLPDPVQMADNLLLPGGFELANYTDDRCDIKTSTGTYIRYPKEIMKMERHFSVLQRWLQK